MHPRHPALIVSAILALSIGTRTAAQEAHLVEREGKVVVTKAGASPAAASVGMKLVPRDKLATGEASRAVLRMSERWLARIDEDTDVEITAGAFGAKSKDTLKLALGGAFIYSREEEGEVKIQTPSATGGLRGTQLLVRVARDGKTWMQVIEGEVNLANELGAVQLRAGEAGEAAMGQAPRKTAVVEARNLLQWALYYPAVLVPEELALSVADQRSFSEILAAYRQGDLPAARDQLPQAAAATPEGRVLTAAVQLAGGRVEAARRELTSVPASHPGRRALERMLAAVLGSETPAIGPAPGASEALAESYYQQSRHDLRAALAAAKLATERAPQSGFAWIRLAELEFSFGRVAASARALDRGLGLSPRHAQGFALRGYLLSAAGQIGEARLAFEQALQLDGGLGSAWLGLGLTKIRSGQLEAGRADLQTAAVVEPTRSFFYSYHAKALGEAGRIGLARKDLALARHLDPADPTPHLYSALQEQRENRYNSAVQAMEESLRLNDNRRVYRSQFLLDQDQAVRHANQAKIFQQSGLGETAVRAATRAVEEDYANPSAHQFLANSYDALRDPNRQSLRYETAWFNEQLLANLLAPVGGGALSQYVSQQEYSRLFAADRQGGSLAAEWRSDDRVDAQASWFTTSGRLSVGLDLAYHRNHGSRPNNAIERTEGTVQAKYQVSSVDIVHTLGQWERSEGGDLAENYANTAGNPGLRFEDRLRPGLLLAGWNHSWAPGVTTLVLGGRLAATQNLTAPRTTQTLLGRDLAFLQPGFLTRDSTGALSYTSPALRTGQPPPVATTPAGSLVFSPQFLQEIAPYLGRGPVTALDAASFDFSTRRDIEIYSWEIQQIWKLDRHTLLAGARWQTGDLNTTARLDLLNPAGVRFFTSPATLQQVAADFSRQTGYVYAFSELMPGLRLIAGASWDRVEHPENFRNPPVSGRPTTSEHANAKLGFTLTPSPDFALRGLYAEAVGGVTYDESVRLEPVQLAGFDQTFRTVISESIVGSVEAPRYRQWGLGGDGKLGRHTWWHAGLSDLHETVRRTTGTFDTFSAPIFPSGAVILPAGTPEHLDYREETATLGLNRLIGADWSLGAAFRRTRASLHQRFPQIPTTLAAAADRRESATLDSLNFQAIRNAASGWFGRADAAWYSQRLGETAAGRAQPTPPGDQFWQFHLQFGRRFQANRYEFTLGVLNLTDRDYRLSPLTYLTSPPRERTAVVRFRASF